MTYICQDCGHLSSVHSSDGCGFRAAGGVPCGCKKLCVAVTRCEMEVWKGVAVGKSAKELSGVVSTKTIDCHKANLYQKLGIHNQAQATALALRLGVIQPHDIPMPNVTVALVHDGGIENSA